MTIRIAAFTILAVALAVPTGVLAVDAAAAVHGLQSASLGDRIKAFYELVDGQNVVAGKVPDRQRLVTSWGTNAEAVQTALERVLTVENETAKKPFDDRFSNYYGDLIAVVAALRDERALYPLLGALTTGGMAQEGIVELGLPALGPLLERVHSTNNHERQAAIRTLGRLYEKVANDSGAAEPRKKIRLAILSVVRDPSPFVRWAAADALGKIKGDDEVDSVLQDLSEHDEYWYASPEGGRVYPVRLAAKRSLRQK